VSAEFFKASACVCKAFAGLGIVCLHASVFAFAGCLHLDDQSASGKTVLLVVEKGQGEAEGAHNSPQPPESSSPDRHCSVLNQMKCLQA
jgi:hypothetical protein